MKRKSLFEDESSSYQQLMKSTSDKSASGQKTTGTTTDKTKKKSLFEDENSSYSILVAGENIKEWEAYTKKAYDDYVKKNPDSTLENDEKRKKLYDEHKAASDYLKDYDAYLEQSKLYSMSSGEIDSIISDYDSQIKALKDEGGFISAILPGGITPSDYSANKDKINQLENESAKYRARRDYVKSQEMTQSLPADVLDALDTYNNLKAQYDYNADMIPKDKNNGYSYNTKQLEAMEGMEYITDKLKSQGYDNVEELAEYRKYMTDTEFTQEFAKGWEDFTKEHPVLSTAANFVLAPSRIITSAAGSLEHLDNVSDLGLNPYSPYYALTHANNAKRQVITDSFDDGLISKNAKAFLYNTAESAVESLVVGTMPGGAALLGLGAYGDTVLNVVQKGGSYEDALLSGIFSGVAEGFFEKVSIGNLKAFKDVPVNGIKAVLKNVGSGILVNASEETLTEIANVISDYMINGGVSDYYNAVVAYMDDGMSEAEAKKKAAADMGSRIFEAGLSGGLMGFGFSIGGSAVSYGKSLYNRYQSGKGIVEGGQLGTLIDGAADVQGDDKYKSLYESVVQTQQAAEKDADYDYSMREYYKAGKLSERLAETTESERNTIVRSAVSDSFKSLGETADIDVLSSAVTKTVFGEKLTHKERAALQDSEYAQRVINEAGDVYGEYSSAWADKTKADVDALYERRYAPETKKYSDENYVNRVKETVIEEGQNKAEFDKQFDLFQDYGRQGVDFETVKDTVPESAGVNERQLKAAYDLGAELNAQSKLDIVTGISAVKDGEVYVTTTAGTVRKLSELNVEAATGKLVRSAAKYDKATANAFIRGYNRSANVSSYERAFDAFYASGSTRSEVKFADAMKKYGDLVKYMDSADVARKAFDLGRAERTKADKSVRQKKQTGKHPAKGEYQSKTVSVGEEAIDEFYSAVAKKLGMDIDRVHSIVNREGRTANAQYDPTQNKMTTSATAKNELQASVHELVHSAFAYNIEKMKSVKKAVIDYFLSQNSEADLEKVLRQYEAAYPDLSRVDIEEEFVCDAIGGMFTTEEGVQNFLEWLQDESGYKAEEKKTILQRITEWLSDIIEAIRDIMNSGELNGAGKLFAKENCDELVRIRKQFLEALDGAGVNYREGGAVEGGVRNSINENVKNQNKVYLAAVEKGDMETAQQMVDNYAIEQGFDVAEDGSPDLLFHGTDAFGFTKIDTSKSDDSITFWATPNMGVAGSYYKGSNYKVREIGKEKVAPKGEKLYYTSSMEKAINTAKPFSSELGQDFSKAKYVKEDKVMRKAEKSMQKVVAASEAVLNGDFSDDIKSIAQSVITASEQGTYDAWSRAINGRSWNKFSEITGVKFWEIDLPEKFNIDKSDISEVTEVDPDVFRMMYHIGDVLEGLELDSEVTIKGETIDKSDIIDTYNEHVAEKGIYGFYHKQNNPFIYDCGYVGWNKIPVPDEAKGDFSKDTTSTRELAEWAFKNGYDAVRLDNVVDVGWYALKEARKPAIVWAFKNPEAQLKSADPVTYDDNGNVIPLSERFNVENKDIRYSFAGIKAKTSNIQTFEAAQRLEDVGKATPEEIRQQTGWFRGYDGMWRFELDDSKMVIRDTDIRSGETKLSEVLDYPQLFEAYPQLKDVTISAFPSIFRFGVKGSYNSERNEISLSDEFLVDAKVHRELEALKKSDEYKTYKDRLESAAREHGEKRLKLSREFKKIREAKLYTDMVDLLYQLDDEGKVEEYKKATEEWQNSALGKRYGEISAELKRMDEVNPQSEIEKAFRESELGKRYHELTLDVFSGGEVINDKDTRNTLIHEIQHAIQYIEGFASGASPKYWKDINADPFSYTPSEIKKLEAVRKKASDYLNLLEDEDVREDAQRYWYLNDHYFDDNLDTEAVDKEITEIESRAEAFGYQDKLDRYFELENKVTLTFNEIERRRKRAPDELYQNTAGEIEARDATARLALTAEERKNTRPDIDRKDVVFSDGGVSYDYGVTQEDVDNYVDAAYKKENTEDIKKYANPSARLMADVSDEIDISGYAHALRDNDIRHIRNSHGEDTNEKYPVTREDIKLIPWIVENYDKVFVKTNSRRKPGIVYVKATSNNIIYYVEAVTEEYHNEKLLVNKQMIKAGFDEIPNLYGLISAINKKESSFQYLADLEKIRKAYVQDVKGNYYADSIPDSAQNVNDSSKNSLPINDFESLHRSNIEKVTELSRVAAQMTAHINYIGSSQTKRVLSALNIQAVAREFKSEYRSKADIHKLSAALTELYEKYEAGRVPYDVATAHIDNIVDMIINESVYMKPEISDYAKEILREVRSGKIKLSEAQKAEAANYFGSYNEFRRVMMGSAVFSEEGTPLDVRWQELCDMYPGRFDRDTVDADQPIMLYEAIGELRNTYNDESGLDLDSVKAQLSAEICAKYISIPTVAQYSNEYAVKERELLESLKAEKQEYKRIYAESYRKAQSEYGGQLKKLRAEQAEEILRAKARMETRVQNIADTRIREKKRNRLIKTVKRLDRLLRTPGKGAPSAGTNKYGQDYVHLTNIPEGLKRTVIDFCSIFVDNDAGVFTGNIRDGVIILDKKINEMLKQYTLLKKSDSYMKTVVSEDMEKKIAKVAEIMGTRRLAQLTAAELDTVNEIADHLITVINNEVEMWVNGKKTKVHDTGKAAKGELEAKGMKGHREAFKGIDKIKIMAYKPIYFFEKIGGVFQTLWNDILDGQDKYVRNIEYAHNRFDEIAKKYHLDSWIDDKAETFTTAQGHEISLTRGQALLVWATWKREGSEGKGTKHLFEGGIVYPDAVKKASEKGKNKLPEVLQKVYKDGTAHRIRVEDMLKIDEWLTDEQKKYADELVHFLSTDIGAWGNEISMQLYGVNKFNLKYYIPFNSAGNYLYKGMGEDGTKLLKSEGFTKETQWDAKNPLVVDDFTQVAIKHIERMSMYNSMVIPLDNFSRVWNYQERADAEGKESMKAIKALFQTAYGDEAQKYVEDFLRDVNGGVMSDSRELGDKWLSKFKKSAVMASASVMIQQPSAIGRAFAEINPKYFVSGIGKNMLPKVYEECKKYAPVAVLKEIGGFDTVSGQSMADWMLKRDYEGKDKLKAFFKDSQFRDEIISYGPAWADRVTWAHIWLACKNEVRVKQNLTGEALLEAAGKRFTEVINKTQVYDSVLSRSAAMRSNTVYMKMITAFMAEPTTSLNMLMSGVDKLKTPDTRKKGAGMIASVATAQLLNSILVSFIYAARDDDEEKGYWEVWSGEFVDNFLNGLNPLTMIPIVKDIFSLISGYSVDRSDMTVISNFVDSINAWRSDNKSIGEKISGTVGSVADLFGIPLKNLIRDVKAVINVHNKVKSGSDSTFVGALTEMRDSVLGVVDPIGFIDNSNDRHLYNAWVKGNKDFYEEYASRYKSGSSIKSALENQIEERYVKGKLDYDEAFELYRKLGYSENEATYKLRELEEPVEDEEAEDKYADFYSFDGVGGIQDKADAEREEERQQAAEKDEEYSEDSDYKWLDEALESGNLKDIETETKYLIDKGVSESDVNSHVSGWLKKNDTDVIAAGNEYVLGDFGTFESTVKLIAERYGVSEALAARAIRSVAGESGKEIEGTIYVNADLHKAIEFGNDTVSKKIASAIIEAKTQQYIAEGKNSYEAQKSARSAVRQSINSKWKETYQKADPATRVQIRQHMYATGAYDYLGQLDDTLKKWRTEWEEEQRKK